MQQSKSIKTQPGQNLQVLIFDNNPVEREGIKILLSQKYDLDMTTAPDDHQKFVETLNSRVFDLIMVDSVLPSGSAFDIILLIRKIHEINPKLPVLVMGSGDHHIALWALQAGATGYIDKRCDQNELIASAQCILKGRRYLHNAIAEELPLLWSKPGELVLPHKRLSNRETQVMLLLVKGITVTEIGEKMGLSKKTVSTYKTRVQEKMGMKSTVDMVKYAIRLGLISTRS